MKPSSPAAQPLAGPVPLPLLVTGIPGVPGYNAMEYFRARYPGQVFGLSQEDNRLAGGGDILACNAEDGQRLARLFDQHRFAAVLNCGGNCALKACELHPELARLLNVGGVEHLLAQTVPRGLRLVHLSVDLVFSGDKPGGYVEEDRPDPVTVYGQTMALAEQRVRELDPKACILRISLPMGVSLSGHAGAIDWISWRFRNHRPATLFFDEIRTPTYTDCLNRLYEVMLGRTESGIFHAGGPRRLSLYEIAQVINRVGGYDPRCLRGIPRKLAEPIPPRAGDVCMDSGKLLRTLGGNLLAPWPLAENLVPTDPDWHRQRPADERRGPEELLRTLCLNPSRRQPAEGSHLGRRYVARSQGLERAAPSGDG